ncbi:hypothetical protein NLG97_g1663 [Lecanicillium saksenae]|uniref:Uncharacterized protein n=1 Tax=Lecanicillium saksenae TaxID=468837 RepID=A0ACC1R4I1_9HYPO|nr:hypothetical protein NLG97_g1663 [Lecanicillium saksenae]
MTVKSESCPRPFSRGNVDDHTYPVHLLDGAKYQHCILTLFIRFNDVLDSEKIRRSLHHLLSIGDWKKLGGRFRTKVDLCGEPEGSSSRLEIHVPREYTAMRPPMQFDAEEYHMSIYDHALGQNLPSTSNDEVMLSPPLDQLRQCGISPGFPLTMEDLIDKDVPQLAFKTISFTDATLLAVTFSHCTWDISGLQGFMKSLELVIDGREDEVPVMLGAKDDILAEIASLNKDSFSPLASLRVASPMAKDRQLRMPNMALEERVLKVPLHIFERLQKHFTMRGLGEEYETLSLQQPDELFMALILQQVALAQSSPRPLHILNIYNARLIMPRIATAKGVYSQNLVLLSPLLVSHATATGPVGPIALAQRDCFANSAVPENIMRSLGTALGAIKADLDITSLTDAADADPILVNNLVKLSSYIEVDLSAAVIRQGENTRTRRNGLGTADLCFLTLPGNSYGMMRVTTVGSYNGKACWIFGELPPRAWDGICAAFDELDV